MPKYHTQLFGHASFRSHESLTLYFQLKQTYASIVAL